MSINEILNTIFGGLISGISVWAFMISKKVNLLDKQVGVLDSRLDNNDKNDTDRKSDNKEILKELKELNIRMTALESKVDTIIKNEGK